MNSEDLIFKNISDETKSTIKPIEIVTPLIYSSIYKDIAKKSDIELNDDLLSNRLIDDKLLQLSNMNDQTTDQVNRLGDSANKAITAIKEKNDVLLHETLAEAFKLKKEIKALKNSLYKDELTKTYNRKWLNDNYLDEEKNNFINKGVVAFIDMNYFKQINDNYGHIAGDKVLLYIVNFLNKTCSNIVRYGGDEFIILFDKDKSEKDVFNILDIGRQTILKKVVHLGEHKFKISYSFGIEKFNIGDSFMKIMKDVDAKMYADKRDIKKIYSF